METSLNVYDYPERLDNSKTIKAKIYVSYDVEIEVPKNWDNEQIIEDIKANVDEYINAEDIIVEEIEI